MSLAFFCLGAGSLFLARALWIDLRTKGDRFGGGWLILAGIAYIGAGIFAPDPTSIVESRLHGLFGLIVIFSSPIVFTLLSRSLIHDERWSEVRASLKIGDDFGVAGFALVLRLYHHFLWIGA